MLTRKNPILAAVLALLLGPLGYGYLGWRYFVIAWVGVAICFGGFAFIAWLLPPWTVLLLWLPLALQAHRVAAVVNYAIDYDPPTAEEAKTWLLPMTALFNLIYDEARLVVVIMGLSVAADRFQHHAFWHGLFMALIGTWVFLWIANIVLGFVFTLLTGLLVEWVNRKQRQEREVSNG